LTALHVAYEDIFNEVAQALDGIVERETPEKILVTAHPGAFQWVFKPADNEYHCCKQTFAAKGLAFEGNLQQISNFRKELFTDHENDISNALSDDDVDFVRRYLTRRPTSWATSDFRLATFRRK
jgi:hypothetical protein